MSEPSEEKVNPKKVLRVDEKGDPILIIHNQIKLVCHHKLTEQTEDGDMVDIKMYPTQKFFAALNEQVIYLLEQSISNAMNEGRTKIMEKDVIVMSEE